MFKVEYGPKNIFDISNPNEERMWVRIPKKEYKSLISLGEKCCNKTRCSGGGYHGQTWSPTLNREPE